MICTVRKHSRRSFTVGAQKYICITLPRDCHEYHRNSCVLIRESVSTDVLGSGNNLFLNPAVLLLF